ncbi:MAG: proton-conducting transporter membrane subunit [Candidatus Bathyarchaeia archaeon]
MLGTLFSNNLLSLLIFWELISLCSYVLISLRSEDQFCVFASFKSFIMTHIGSMALLLAAVVIYFATGTLDFSEIGLKIPPGNQLLMLIFPLLLIAALPKTVLFPLHTWLPDGTVAPTSATVVFHVCGFQSGVYLIIRFFFNIFHNHIISGFMMPLPLLFGSISLWSFVISLIGAITLIVGALNGIVENDFKRIVAYGTISGLGCIVMATGLGTSLCVASSLFLMISHALCYGLLFLCAGSVIYASGKHNINELGGLHRYMPITSFCCLIGAVTLSTAPLLSEFASKFLLLHATINVGSIFFTVMAVLACVFNAAIALRLLHSVFMQRSADEAFSFPVKDPPTSMSVPMILVSAILITFGVSPAIPLSLLVIPAVKQMGFPMNIVSRLEFIGSPIGFWNPMAVAISLLTLLAVFAGVMVFSSRFAAAYRRPVSEETFKPFICGEDLNLLDGPHGYHFYHALTNVFRVEGFCNTSNVDHVYNVFSKKWNDFAVKMRLLDIQQSYVAAISCFLAGAVIVMLVAILMV